MTVYVNKEFQGHPHVHLRHIHMNGVCQLGQVTGGGEIQRYRHVFDGHSVDTGFFTFRQLCAKKGHQIQNRSIGHLISGVAVFQRLSSQLAGAEISQKIRVFNESLNVSKQRFRTETGAGCVLVIAKFSV